MISRLYALNAWSKEDAADYAAEDCEYIFKYFAAKIFTNPTLAERNLDTDVDRVGPGGAYALMAGWEPGRVATAVRNNLDFDLCNIRSLWDLFQVRHTKHLLGTDNLDIACSLSHLRLILEAYRFCAGTLPGIPLAEYDDRMAAYQSYEPHITLPCSYLDGTTLGNAAFGLLRGESLIIRSDRERNAHLIQSLGTWAQRCRELGHTQIKPILVELAPQEAGTHSATSDT
jgi:hypothetical protein